MLLLEKDDLRSDDGFNPLTGYNGYYRPATRTQSRWSRSLLYQMPEERKKDQLKLQPSILISIIIAFSIISFVIIIVIVIVSVSISTLTAGIGAGIKGRVHLKAKLDSRARGLNDKAQCAYALLMASKWNVVKSRPINQSEPFGTVSSMAAAAVSGNLTKYLAHEIILR